MSTRSLRRRLSALKAEPGQNIAGARNNLIAHAEIDLTAALDVIEAAKRESRIDPVEDQEEWVAASVALIRALDAFEALP